jgi:hypothetical protein
MKNLIYAVLAMLIISGCSNGGTQTSTIEGIKFDSIVVDSSLALSGVRNAPRCQEALSIRYATGARARLINQTLSYSGILPFSIGDGKSRTRSAVDTFVKQQIKEYAKDYSDLYNQDKSRRAFYNVGYRIRTAIENRREGILNYFAYYTYTSGGSADTHQTLVNNINVKTGKLITLDDLFISGYELPVKTLIIEELSRKYHLDFTTDNLYIPYNFILDSHKITFIYNENEIAPHQAGELQIDIDIDKVEDFLKNGYK